MRTTHSPGCGAKGFRLGAGRMVAVVLPSVLWACSGSGASPKDAAVMSSGGVSVEAGVPSSGGASPLGGSAPLDGSAGGTTGTDASRTSPPDGSTASTGGVTTTGGVTSTGGVTTTGGVTSTGGVRTGGADSGVDTAPDSAVTAGRMDTGASGDASATGGSIALDGGLAGPTFPPRFVGNIDNQGQIASDFLTYWDQLTPETAGKWPSVQPTSGEVFNWTMLDALYAYTEQHKIPFKQTAFVWGVSHPVWIAALTPETGPVAVKRWMKSFCDRYPNIRLIDVVRDPPPHTTPLFADDIGGGNRTTWDWVINSFTWAREACPKAVLMVADYSIIEYGADNRNMINLVKILKQAGAPIDAIGAQMASVGTLPTSTIKSFLETLISETGLPIYVDHYRIPQQDDEKQRAIFAEHLPLFWENPNVRGISLDGYRYGELSANGGSHLLRSDGTPRPALTWLMTFLKR